MILLIVEDEFLLGAFPHWESKHIHPGATIAFRTSLAVFTGNAAGGVRAGTVGRVSPRAPV